MLYLIQVKKLTNLGGIKMTLNYERDYLYDLNIAGIENWTDEVLEIRLRHANNFMEKCERDIYGKDKPRAPRQVYESYQWAKKVKGEIEGILKYRGVMEKSDIDILIESWWNDLED